MDAEVIIRNMLVLDESSRFINYLAAHLPHSLISQPTIQGYFLQTSENVTGLLKIFQPSISLFDALANEIAFEDALLPETFKNLGHLGDRVIKDIFLEMALPENIIRLLRYMEDLSEYEYEIALQTEYVKRQIYNTCPFRTFTVFILSGKTPYHNRMFLTRDLLDTAIERSNNIVNLYLACPFKNDPDVKRKFLTGGNPIELLPLFVNQTLDDLIFSIDHVHPRGMAVLYTTFAYQHTFNVDLRERVLIKCDPGQLLFLLMTLDDATDDEVLSIIDRTTTRADRLYDHIHQKNSSAIRMGLLELATPENVNKLIIKFNKATLEEFSVAFEKTDNGFELFNYCPFKQSFLEFQTPITEPYAELIEDSPEIKLKIIDEIKICQKELIVTIYSRIRQKDDVDIKNYVLDYADSEDLHVVYLSLIHI